MTPLHWKTSERETGEPMKIVHYHEFAASNWVDRIDYYGKSRTWKLDDCKESFRRLPRDTENEVPNAQYGKEIYELERWQS